MALQITTNPELITPDLSKSIKDNIARKSGNKHVVGNTYKQRTKWKRLCDFVGASRSGSVIGKAYFESKQYSEAAVLRKNFQAEQLRDQMGRHLTDAEYDYAVWNSNGVQNRTTREDFIRYSQNFYTNDDDTTSRNMWARRFSSLAHSLHGVCEMNAAPTGMTSNVFRNSVTSKTDEQSTKNKLFMFGMLAFIGVGTTEALRYLRGFTNFGQFAGQSLASVLVAFPAASSALGGLGTLAGVASQILVEKQALSEQQQQKLSRDVSENLQKLLVPLKSIKGNAQLIKVTAKAMQGKHHILNKVGSSYMDRDGIPDILTKALDGIDLNKSDHENMCALKRALGEYLQVEKPNQRTWWSRYKYAKAVTRKESHYVALASLVDHMTVKHPHAAALKDLRRQLEENAAPKFHNFLLRSAAVPAALFDYFANTNTSGTLKKWATKEYQDEQVRKMNDPSQAPKNCFKGEYMAKHIQEYRPITRGLIKLAEGARIFNMNIVLASNANLSRIFNNLTKGIYSVIGTSPASRSMCNSMGRFLGGAVLAIIFGTVIPIATDAGGGSTDVGLGDGFPVKFSVTNIGILMFLVSGPTLVVQGLAQLSARLEGWKGPVVKNTPSSMRKFEFPS